MKKIVLAAVLLLSVSFVRAQVNFGIKAGYNSSLNLDNVASVRSGEYDLTNVKSELNNGFHLGAFGRLFFDKVYIQPELLYSMQKKDYEFTIQDAMNPDVDVEKYVTFSTIDIPLLLGYRLLDLKVVNLRVFAGPKFRLDAGSQVSFKNLTNNDPLDREALEGEFKNSQVGLEFGAGVDVLMFTLDARMNIINSLHTATWQDKPDLNSNFVISLGWKIF
ncbi:MAG: PorT family protein [Paludibacteraceae bacterium]|nr:PorT family protein [Paludibacteraceae bacterium]